jgi:lycopene beta-cyclase
MDATVEQIGGYRFVYCLPFDAETVFVEDTYYGDSADLDVGEVRGRIADYAAAQGWSVTEVAREETGWLPVVMAGDFDAIWPRDDAVARIGVRAGRFHATTGYSLPDAVRTAAALPALVDRADLGPRLRTDAATAWRRQRFYRMLGAMLFRAAEPAERYRIFQRFYRLSPALIARFYAGASSGADRLRLLSGRPPVPIGRAIRAIGSFDWL